MRGGNIGKRGFPLQREAECRELVYSVRPCGRMVVVYIYDLEYIEAEELVRGTVFDGEDVESHGPTVSSVDECLVLLSVHAAFYGVFIGRFGTVDQPGGQIDFRDTRGLGQFYGQGVRVMAAFEIRRGGHVRTVCDAIRSSGTIARCV